MKYKSKAAGLLSGLLVLASLLTSALPARANVAVSVDYNTVVRNLDPLFLGLNYVAYWDPIQGDTPSREAVRRSGAKLLRFPGGTPASYYDWANPYLDAWSSTSPLQLWQYAQAAGCRVLFETDATTNHSNDPSGAHAAAFVTYAKNNNIDAPLWEVDNEPDNGMPSDYDWTFLQWYFNAFNSQATAMKAANPAIKIMGPAGTNTYYWWALHSLDMFRQQCDANADAISLHVYDGPNYPGYANIEGVAELWQSRMDYIRSVYPTKPIYITEWNSTGQPGAASRWAGLLVANADVLGAFAKSGVTASCYYGSIHTVNDNWGLLGGSGDVIAADQPVPQYFALPLWSKMGDRVLNATNPADPSTVLSVWSHKKVDGSVQVMLINKTTAQSVDLTFNGYNPAGKTISVYEAKASAGGAADTDIYYNNVLTPNASTTDLPGPLTDSTSTSTYTRALPAYSVTVLDFAGGGVTVAPGVPAGLSATPNNAQIQLNWTGSANNPASYTVKRSTTNGGPYTTIASPIPTNYLDTGLTNGTTYYYVVSATNSAGTSANSAQVSGIPALQAPSGLTANAAIAQISLSWTGSLGAASYTVKRSTTNGGPYTNAATGVTNTSYTDTGLTVGTVYYYVVSATNASGQSPNSGQASGIPTSSLAIDCGGGSAGAFVADTDVIGGSGAQNNTGPCDTSAVTNPAPLLVYQTERYGNSTYTIPGPTSGASYKVRLHFTEDYVAAVGARTFNVVINGAQVLTNFDIYATTGAQHKATIQEFTVTANASGVTIQLVSVVNQAKIDGIEVIPIGGVTIPAAPAGLTATSGNALVALAWNASSGATAYNVLRSTTSGSGYASVVTGLAATNYTNAGLTNGTTYYFVVTATNSGGTSGNSSQASATPSGGVTIPAAPTGLTATGGNAQVALSWTASTGATSYNVLRSTVNGSGYASVVSGLTVTNYTNTGLTNGTTYYFVVTATNTAGTSGNSAQASATPSASSTALSRTAWVVSASASQSGQPPTMAIDGDINTRWSVGAVQSNGQWFQINMGSAQTFNKIVLDSGTDTGDYPRGYSITVSNDGVTWGSAIATGTPTASPVTITFSTTTAQYIKITQTGSTSGSYWSEHEINVYTPGGVSIPTAPTGLTALPGNAQVALNWSASSGATSYNVLRSTTSGSGYASVVTGLTATSYVCTGETNGTTYYFVVTAANSAGTSGNSAQASATPIAPPASPTGLSATPGNAQVTLTWTASSGATSYSVLRSTTSGSGYAGVATGITVTNYTNAGLTNGTAYYFVVTATNAGGTSGNSAQASATPSAGGTQLTRTAWIASASQSQTGQPPSNAIDGDASEPYGTRWSTGAFQSPGQWFQIDMGSAQTFNKIVLDSGSDSNDYPNAYSVAVSNDGVTWGSAIATGNPTASPVTITFTNQTARYFRITQTGSTSGAYWSIHEIYAYN